MPVLWAGLFLMLRQARGAGCIPVIGQQSDAIDASVIDVIGNCCNLIGNCCNDGCDHCRNTAAMLVDSLLNLRLHLR